MFSITGRVLEILAFPAGLMTYSAWTNTQSPFEHRFDAKISETLPISFLTYVFLPEYLDEHVFDSSTSSIALGRKNFFSIGNFTIAYSKIISILTSIVLLIFSILMNNLVNWCHDHRFFLLEKILKIFHVLENFAIKIINILLIFGCLWLSLDIGNKILIFYYLGLTLIEIFSFLAICFKFHEIGKNY
jgi:hypothetical protein